jgi:hypothetical protein
LIGSTFQNTKVSKSIPAFLNNSKETIESFQPHTGISALFDVEKIIFSIVLSELISN